MFANVDEALTDLVVEMVGGKGVRAELVETFGVERGFKVLESQCVVEDSDVRGLVALGEMAERSGQDHGGGGNGGSDGDE